jgi:hypothetical protein
MVNAPHLVALVRGGATFVNGKLVERPGKIASSTTFTKGLAGKDIERHIASELGVLLARLGRKDEKRLLRADSTNICRPRRSNFSWPRRG